MNLTLIRGMLCLSQTNFTYKFRKTTAYHVFTAEAMRVPLRLEPAAEAVLILNCRSNNKLATKGGNKK
ncbi:hypothetical protein RYH73_16420 [Olivibacter sp. CPCC 100613]